MSLAILIYNIIKYNIYIYHIIYKFIMFNNICNIVQFFSIYKL